MIWVYNATPSTELYHHGILGQRWGKKNGPPYPLDSTDHSASEKKAGWRKSLDKGESKTDNKSASSEKKGLTDKQKKAIKIGAAVAVTTLAAIGTYQLYKSGKLDGVISKGKGAADFLLGKEQLYGSIDSAAEGIKKLATPESLSETLKKANPNLGNDLYKNNCTLCGITSFLRQAGYDVKAGSTGGNRQILGGIVEECFRGATVKDGSAVKFGRSRKDAEEMLVKLFGDNASGVVGVPFSGGGGHTFNWKIQNGVVSFFDGQNGNDDTAVSRYWRLIDPSGELTIARLDNAEVIEDAIKKWLE